MLISNLSTIVNCLLFFVIKMMIKGSMSKQMYMHLKKVKSVYILDPVSLVHENRNIKFHSPARNR